MSGLLCYRKPGKYRKGPKKKKNQILPLVPELSELLSAGHVSLRGCDSFPCSRSAVPEAGACPVVLGVCSWCCQWNWGSFTGSRAKHFGSLTHGRVRSGGLFGRKQKASLGVQYLVSDYPTMEKSTFVFSGAGNRASVQRFCAAFELSPLEPPSSTAGPRRLPTPLDCYEILQGMG